MAEIKYIICGIVIALVLFFIIIMYNRKCDTMTNKENIENTKTIKYFGGDYCPYSNTNSIAYNVMKEFEVRYPDVLVEYYWSGKDNAAMEKYNILYVPTILNSKDQPIELKLPKDTVTEGKTNDELRGLLLENIYNNV